MYHHGADAIHGMSGETQEGTSVLRPLTMEVDMPTRGTDAETDFIFGVRQLAERVGLNGHQAQAALGYLLERYRREACEAPIVRGLGLPGSIKLQP